MFSIASWGFPFPMASSHPHAERIQASSEQADSTPSYQRAIESAGRRTIGRQAGRYSDANFWLPLTNPHFISLSKQVRLCPRCGAKTRIAGTLSGDVAKELCDECGYFRGLLAPEWAMGKRVEEARTSSPFSVIDGGSR